MLLLYCGVLSVLQSLTRRVFICLHCFVCVSGGACFCSQDLAESILDYEEDYDDTNHSENEWGDEHRRGIRKRFTDHRPAFVLEVGGVCFSSREQRERTNTAQTFAGGGFFKFAVDIWERGPCLPLDACCLIVGIADHVMDAKAIRQRWGSIQPQAPVFFPQIFFSRRLESLFVGLRQLFLCVSLFKLSPSVVLQIATERTFLGLVNAALLSTRVRWFDIGVNPAWCSGERLPRKSQ